MKKLLRLLAIEIHDLYLRWAQYDMRRGHPDEPEITLMRSRLADERKKLLSSRHT